MRLLLLLAACGGEAGPADGSLDTSALFPLADGGYAAYRHLGLLEYAEAGTDTLDEEDLLLARTESGGCGGTAWRMELRNGGEWEGADAVGALHFDDSAGLAICAVEDATGASEALSAPIVLWDDADGLVPDATVQSGDWSVAVEQVEDVGTYFGVFPKGVRFALAGSGSLDGWVLTLADAYGLILLETDDTVSDLVFRR